jgi:hypothetical protein
MPVNYSPVDFYNPDLEKFPDFDKIRGKMVVKINKGDALFIPAFWWHHVKSSKSRNLAINFWYTTNYMSEMFLRALEDKEI